MGSAATQATRQGDREVFGRDVDKWIGYSREGVSGDEWSMNMDLHRNTGRSTFLHRDT